MARFGGGDAFFGLDDDASGKSFDLDTDALNEGSKPFETHDMAAALPSLPQPDIADDGEMPPGLEDLDPSALQELISMMQSGVPDPVKLRKFLKANPALHKVGMS